MGQISSFTGSLSNAFASFTIEAGPHWENVADEHFTIAQTQVDYGAASQGGMEMEMGMEMGMEWDGIYGVEIVMEIMI